MNQSENPASSMAYDQIHFFAKMQGAGAAALVRAPTTFSATSWIGFMHASNNFASLTAADHTRSGAGVYTVKLRDTLPVILDLFANVAGTDGKKAQITDYNPTTRVISVKTYNAAGAATDLASTDFITFTLVGSKSVPVY